MPLYDRHGVAELRNEASRLRRLFENGEGTDADFRMLNEISLELESVGETPPGEVRFHGLASTGPLVHEAVDIRTHNLYGERRERGGFVR